MDIGICVPFDDGFGVEKLVSVKSVGTDKISLFLSENSGNYDSKFIPLQEGTAFEGMIFLKNAKFERRGDIVGLLVKTD